MCSAGTTMANAIDLGNAAKVTRNGDSSNYPDTVLSGCADPADFGNGTKGDGGDVVSAAAAGLNTSSRDALRLAGSAAVAARAIATWLLAAPGASWHLTRAACFMSPLCPL